CIFSLFLFDAPAVCELSTFPYTTLFRSSSLKRPRKRLVPGTTIAVILPSCRLNSISIMLPRRLPSRILMTSLVRKSDDLDMEKRSEEHTSELQSRENLVCRLLLEKKKKK